MVATQKNKKAKVVLTAADLKPVADHPLMAADSRSRCIGFKVTPQDKKDLTRYVRWPRYIRVQRQKRVLLKRLKVPPAIAQFEATLDKNQTAAVLKIVDAYKPETKVETRARHRTEAAARAADENAKFTRKTQVTFGIKEVVNKIEKGQAKLVVIAHDVDPIELVVFLPALCRKFNVPYCFVKGKARLGQSVHTKTCTAIAICEVNAEHKAPLEELRSAMMSQYNDNLDLRRSWGGTIMSKAFMEKQAERARAAKK